MKKYLLLALLIIPSLANLHAMERRGYVLGAETLRPIAQTAADRRVMERVLGIDGYLYVRQLDGNWRRAGQALVANRREFILGNNNPNPQEADETPGSSKNPGDPFDLQDINTRG